MRRDAQDGHTSSLKGHPWLTRGRWARVIALISDGGAADCTGTYYENNGDLVKVASTDNTDGGRSLEIMTLSATWDETSFVATGTYADGMVNRWLGSSIRR